MQILTMLQESWDKKDHFLIYEQKRCGKTIKTEHEQMTFTLSESAYLLDRDWARLKLEIEKPKSPKKRAKKTTVMKGEK